MVICMLALGLLLDNIPAGSKAFAYNLHKSLGILILSLMLLRLFWRLINPIPQQPADSPRWELSLVRLTHGAFYALLFLTPISGWIMSTATNRAPNFFWLAKTPAPGIPNNAQQIAWLANNLHSFFAWSIIVVLALHILGALKHHFINHDQILQRMLHCIKKK